MTDNESNASIESQLVDETAKLVAEGEEVTQEMVVDPFFESLKEALRKDAKQHMKKGTIKLPVDPEEFATRLESSPLMRALAMKHEDYVRAVKEVCDELGIERVQ